MAAIDSRADGQDPLLPASDVEEEEPAHGSLLKLMVGAIGVVYGDIGTSPLYTMRECFGGVHGIAYSPENVMGLVSLVLWALILVVTLKYVLFVMQADNRGEGGILALLALARRGGPIGPLTLTALGVAGAALFYGDAIITPAISVLSAVEGLTVITPALEPAVLPVAVAILVGLFVVQRWGTGRVGAAFGPIMILWFATLALLGLVQIVQRPEVLTAFDPRHAIGFFADNGFLGFAALGAVFLAVTGGEALYADMGHFGRPPLKVAWLGFVLPALALNYLGQAAHVIEDPAAVANPFFAMAPAWALPPLVGLATLATIIASQAVISGAFSLTSQAIQLGLCPRLTIRHTSAALMGQIYMPHVNWALLVGVLGLVIAFGSSTGLAAAYGIAVTGTMALTTLLAFNVVVGVWRWPVGLATLAIAGFLALDLAFFSANALKIVDGGWLPVLTGIVIYLLMSTWRTGRQLLATRLRESSLPLTSFFRRLREKPPLRVPGTAVYLTSDADMVPHALLHNLKHNKVLHERLIFLTVQTLPEPRVPRAERILLEEPLPGVLQIRARYGFMQQPSVPGALAWCSRYGVDVQPMQTSFFVGRETPMPTPAPGMWLWREHLFAFMARNASTATEFFRIPADRVVELGTQVPI